MPIPEFIFIEWVFLFPFWSSGLSALWFWSLVPVRYLHQGFGRLHNLWCFGLQHCFCGSVALGTGMASEVPSTHVPSCRSGLLPQLIYECLPVPNTLIYTEGVKAPAHRMIPTISLMFIHHYFCLVTITRIHSRDPIAHKVQTFTIGIDIH